MSKKCPDCGLILDLSNFYVSKGKRPDGLSYRCKKCVSNYAKLNKVKTNIQRKERRHRETPLKRDPKRAVRYRSRGKEYGENWNEIRKEIYKRDSWICQECGYKCGCKANVDTTRKIQCHHIDYDVLNNNSDNLITLCASCHAKTNYNRLNWSNYYTQKILERIL